MRTMEPGKTAYACRLSKSCVQKGKSAGHLASLQGLDRRANIVLLPELAVPIGFERQLKQAAETLEAIVIAGLDYRIETAEPVPTVSNEAVIVVPRKLNGKRIARRTEIRRVGKTYPAPSEKKKLQSIRGGGVKFMPSPTIWIFESPDLGNLRRCCLL